MGSFVCWFGGELEGVGVPAYLGFWVLGGGFLALMFGGVWFEIGWYCSIFAWVV